jgi:hypothetical protein
VVTSWQKDSLSQRAAVELLGCRFNSCWQACNCIPLQLLSDSFKKYILTIIKKFPFEIFIYKTMISLLLLPYLSRLLINISHIQYWLFATFLQSVAKPARQFGHAMQILNHYHYSFLYKLIVFTVYEQGNICIAWPWNCRAGFVTACNPSYYTCKQFVGVFSLCF